MSIVYIYKSSIMDYDIIRDDYGLDSKPLASQLFKVKNGLFI